MAISASPPEPTRKAARALGVRFPMLVDEDMTVIGRYGTTVRGMDASVPATFVVDRDLRIAYRRVGKTVVDRPSPYELVKVVEELRDAQWTSVSGEGATRSARAR